MKDAKGHGSDKRGGESAGEKLRRLMKPPSMIPGYPKLPAGHSFKKRKPDQLGGGGSGGGGLGGGGGGGSMHPKSGAHTAGIHAATAGKTLAELSAAATNQNIPAPVIGGRR